MQSDDAQDESQRSRHDPDDKVLIVIGKEEDGTQSYSDMVKRLKEGVQAHCGDSTIKKVKRTKSGAMEIHFKERKSDTERHIREAMQGIKVEAPRGRMTALNARDIDILTTKEEIKQKLSKNTGKTEKI